MTTIKEELKSKLKKNKEKLEKEAREFINDFIIPTFRIAFDEKPLSDVLVIYFTESNGKISCEVNGVERKIEKNINVDILYKAANIADDFDIKVDFRAERNEEVISFILDLRK